MNRPKPTYALRNVLLRLLGFGTYAQYLACDMWVRIRTAVIVRDGSRCVLCGASAYAVHHLDYRKATLVGETMDGLVSICDMCHKKVEFTRSGKKRTLVQSVATYHSIIRKMARWNSPKPGRCSHCKNKAKTNSTVCRLCKRKGLS